MQQSHIRAVIFDLGGVILRTEDPASRLALAERLGLTRSGLEEAVFNNPTALAAERGMATQAEVWSTTAARLGLPAEDMPRFFAEFFTGDQVDFALLDFIRALRPAYTTALLSNTWQVDLPRFLREELRIPDTFDVVISSAQRRVRKPDPEIFHLALELCGVEAREAVFVDDFGSNIAAAAALGLAVVHFREAAQAMAALRVLGVAPVVDSGGENAGLDDLDG